MTIKAIETKYKGYRFRSRIEARWAVFFDAMGYKWEYEKEGFDLGELGYYLPDFFIYDSNYAGGTWVEIKGNIFTDIENEKCKSLSQLIKMPCLMLSGDIAVKPYPAWSYSQLFFCYFTEPLIQLAPLRYLEEVRIGGGYEYLLEYENQMRKGVEAARGARFEHGVTISA